MTTTNSSFFTVMNRIPYFRKKFNISKLFQWTKAHSIHGTSQSLFNPTDEHQSLRNMVRNFVEKKVDPQATEYNKHEKFNVDLFRELGELGLLGITVDTQYGGSGMDAIAAVIVHGL